MQGPLWPTYFKLKGGKSRLKRPFQWFIKRWGRLLDSLVLSKFDSIRSQWDIANLCYFQSIAMLLVWRRRAGWGWEVCRLWHGRRCLVRGCGSKTVCRLSTWPVQASPKRWTRSSLKRPRVVLVRPGWHLIRNLRYQDGELFYAQLLFLLSKGRDQFILLQPEDKIDKWWIYYLWRLTRWR